MEPSIIEIDNFLISSEIFTEYFCCDYQKCKGCCCIIGDSGAPLEKEECRSIERNFSSFSKYMSDQGLLSVKRQGLWITDSDGDLVTPLINGEECAFTHFDKDNNCMCAIEIAHSNNKSDFKKPSSCWLYPIRVSKLSNGMTALNLHRWRICMDAFIKGDKEKIPVFKFLKEPIIASFGQDLYSKMEEIYLGYFQK